MDEDFDASPVREDTAGPIALPYRESRASDVVCSDAALRSLVRTRTWALLCAIGMFVYAVPGAVLGVIWIIVAINRAPGVGLAQFVIIVPPNLIGAPLALVGGIVALRYFNAVGRAYTWRNVEDLDRVAVRLHQLWCWAGVTVLALLAMPVIIIVTGLALRVW